MQTDPFLNSKSLAKWVSYHLKDRGIDEVADWRMLEHWFQVEIFRLATLNLAGTWHHIGNYEQPYHTERPRSGAKTKTKWVDLVLATPDPFRPDSVVWVGLKDIGRNKNTAANNSKGLGHDLAALWTLNPTKSKELWLNPQPHSKDQGRTDEWEMFGSDLDKATQLVAQIVIGPKSVECGINPYEIIDIWSKSFLQQTGDLAPEQTPEIIFEQTAKFYVFCLVAKLLK